MTNGTSTKQAVGANVARDDIVLVDPQLPQEHLHAIMMTGTVPIFPQPRAITWASSGPITRDQFSRESIQKRSTHTRWSGQERRSRG